MSGIDKVLGGDIADKFFSKFPESNKEVVVIGIKQGCPFCGNEADTNEDGMGCSGKYYLSCMSAECGAEGPVRKTLDKAIVAWNTNNGNPKTDRTEIITELERLEDVGWVNEENAPRINPYIIREAISFLKKPER
jgi:hypothetical protein